jgi:hypothetical protein
MLKKYFLEKCVCLECNQSFDKETDNKNFLSFSNHLKILHNMTNEEYYTKYFLKDNEGICACGCGNKTKYHKGKYLKYFSNHKNFVVQSNDVLLKIKKSKEKYDKLDFLLEKTGITYDELKKTYDDFIKLDKPISVLSKNLSIDFRTLKSYWFKAGLVKNKEIFKRICLKSKTKWLNKPITPNNNVIECLNNALPIIKELLKENDKVTFNQIITVVGLDINKNYLGWFLKENLTFDELKKVKFVKHSQIEIDFYNVLKFYFGKSVSSSFELDGKVFDYKLGGKILIELDGEFWHSSDEAKINDTLKNKIAKLNNFILIRVSDKHVKSLNFINKLKKIYDETKKI